MSVTRTCVRRTVLGQYVILGDSLRYFALMSRKSHSSISTRGGLSGSGVGGLGWSGWGQGRGALWRRGRFWGPLAGDPLVVCFPLSFSPAFPLPCPLPEAWPRIERSWKMRREQPSTLRKRGPSLSKCYWRINALHEDGEESSGSLSIDAEAVPGGEAFFELEGRSTGSDCYSSKSRGSFTFSPARSS